MQLETEMMDMCEDYENRLKAGQINTKALQKKLKDVRHKFALCRKKTIVPGVVHGFELCHIVRHNVRLNKDAGEFQRYTRNLQDVEEETDLHSLTLQAMNDEFKMLDDEFNDMHERLSHVDATLSKLNTDNFVLVRRSESIEYELKQVKDYMYKLDLNQGSSLRDNIENVKPGGEAASDYERQLLDLQVAFDRRESILKCFRQKPNCSN
uniref:t-SNARE coiled-coil homology domain-containing protein n=1 Tax=Panagrellus redivivus TaxID=6233 RepID=A0A7E4V034_PANRE